MSSQSFLELRDDTIDSVRREVGLEKVAEMKAKMDLLKEWLQQQQHFKRKDFPEHFLEFTLIASKGSVERAKRALDKLCTLRTLWPKFFGVTDIKNEFADIFSISTIAIMPMINKNNERVFILRVDKKLTSSAQILNYFRYLICMADYLKNHDYVISFHHVVDLSKVNISDVLAMNNPMELKQIFTILMECYGLRFKGMYFITPSKLIEALIAMIKSFIKPKLAARLHHFTAYEQLVDVLGKQILPTDMGGTGPALRDVHDMWASALSSEENIKHLHKMNDFGTNEDLRSSLDYNQEYAGMPGTFRFMSVD